MLIGYIVKLLAITTLYFYMYSVNKKRDREQAISSGDDEQQREKARREGIEGGMHDLTELDNRGFRYVL